MNSKLTANEIMQLKTAKEVSKNLMLSCASYLIDIYEHSIYKNEIKFYNYQFSNIANSFDFIIYSYDEGFKNSLLNYSIFELYTVLKANYTIIELNSMFNGFTDTIELNVNLKESNNIDEAITFIRKQFGKMQNKIKKQPQKI